MTISMISFGPANAASSLGDGLDIFSGSQVVSQRIVPSATPQRTTVASPGSTSCLAMVSTDTAIFVKFAPESEHPMASEDHNSTQNGRVFIPANGTQVFYVPGGVVASIVTAL